MDAQKLRTLRILEQLDNDTSQSQRDLSKKLNMSLGLVNAFLKRLAQKGYFKINTIPRNRAKYILTPKGVLEKTRLTYEYIQYTFKYYRDARNRVKHILKDLAKNNIREIVFYGSGDLAEIAYVSLQETPLKLIAVVDDNQKGKTFLGHRIRSSDTLENLAFDKILITAMSASENHLDSLRKRNIHKDKIVLIQ